MRLFCSIVGVARDECIAAIWGGAGVHYDVYSSVQLKRNTDLDLRPGMELVSLPCSPLFC